MDTGDGKMHRVLRAGGMSMGTMIITAMGAGRSGLVLIFGSPRLSGLSLPVVNLWRLKRVFGNGLIEGEVHV